MKKILVFLSLSFFLFAGGVSARTLPNPGILPDSPLFFFDLLFEKIQLFFTFNPKDKLVLTIAFAAERVAEVKTLLAQKGADASGIEVALTNLTDQHRQAADLLEGIAKNENVETLAKSTDDEFVDDDTILDSAFKEVRERLKLEETSIVKQIEEVKKSGDTKKLAELNSQTGTLEDKLVALQDKKQAAESAREVHQDRIEEHLGQVGEVTGAVIENKLNKVEASTNALEDELDLVEKEFQNSEASLQP